MYFSAQSHLFKNQKKPRGGRVKFTPSILILAILATLIPSATLLYPEKTHAFFSCPNIEVPPGVAALTAAKTAAVAAKTSGKALSATAVPVSDASTQGYLDALLLINTSILQFSVSSANSTTNTSTKQCILDGLMKVIARAIIDQLTSSIIDWIHNGFQGGPTFVTDPAGFFGNIADQELGRFIDGSALGFVCDPLRINLQFAFLAERSRYTNPSRCSITGIIQNLKSFTDGNFSDGGWKGWIQMTTVPQNNQYGAFLLAQQQLSLNISGRQSLAATQLNWGRGFRSLLDKAGLVQTPGSLIQDQLNQATGNDLSYLNLARNFDDIAVALVNAGITQVINSTK
jgi:hypothetical protein